MVACPPQQTAADEVAVDPDLWTGAVAGKVGAAEAVAPTEGFEPSDGSHAGRRAYNGADTLLFFSKPTAFKVSSSAFILPISSSA